MTTEVILRASGHEEFTEHATMLRAGVFGELVKVASPAVERHHSDLYHDAVWLSARLSGPTAFYYGVRPAGTLISTDRALVEQFSRVMYRIELQCDDGTWSVTTEQRNAE